MTTTQTATYTRHADRIAAAAAQAAVDAAAYETYMNIVATDPNADPYKEVARTYFANADRFDAIAAVDRHLSTIVRFD